MGRGKPRAGAARDAGDAARAGDVGPELADDLRQLRELTRAAHEAAGDLRRETRAAHAIRDELAEGMRAIARILREEVYQFHRKEVDRNLKALNRDIAELYQHAVSDLTSRFETMEKLISNLAGFKTRADLIDYLVRQCQAEMKSLVADAFKAAAPHTSPGMRLIDAVLWVAETAQPATGRRTHVVDPKAGPIEFHYEEIRARDRN